MNNRIKELAEQADLIHWDTLPSGARTPDYDSVVNAKRFAKLIVRECINIALDIKDEDSTPSTTDPFVMGYFRACDKITQAYKEEFGLEE